MEISSINLQEEDISSPLSVPFPTIFKKTYSKDIYSGNEIIPFDKRDPLYQSILRSEFSEAIKEFNNTIDK
jgi:hypothetical protein